MNLKEVSLKSFFSFGKESSQKKDFGRENFAKENKEILDKENLGRESFCKGNIGDFVKKSFSKKKLLICLVLIFILAGASFFYYWFFYETPPEKWDEAKYSPPSDYTVKETADGLMVENKKAGLSFEVPSGWRVKKSEFGNYIAFYSPDAVGSSRMGKIEKGCEVVVEIIKVKTSIDGIRERSEYVYGKNGYFGEYEGFEIKERKALRSVAAISALDLYGTGIHIPINKFFLKNRLYYFSLSSNLENKEDCSRLFDDFLETIEM